MHSLERRDECNFRAFAGMRIVIFFSASCEVYGGDDAWGAYPFSSEDEIAKSRVFRGLGER